MWQEVHLAQPRSSETVFGHSASVVPGNSNVSASAKGTATSISNVVIYVMWLHRLSLCLRRVFYTCHSLYRRLYLCPAPYTVPYLYLDSLSLNHVSLSRAIETGNVNETSFFSCHDRGLCLRLFCLCCTRYFYGCLCRRRSVVSFLLHLREVWVNGSVGMLCRGLCGRCLARDRDGVVLQVVHPWLCFCVEGRVMRVR